jgi:hypothetical protein
MPSNRRTKIRESRVVIGSAVLAAWDAAIRARNSADEERRIAAFQALDALLAVRPWEFSPLDVTQAAAPDWVRGANRERWQRASALRQSILAAKAARRGADQDCGPAILIPDAPA